MQYLSGIGDSTTQLFITGVHCSLSVTHTAQKVSGAYIYEKEDTQVTFLFTSVYFCLLPVT